MVRFCFCFNFSVCISRLICFGFMCVCVSVVCSVFFSSFLPLFSMIRFDLILGFFFQFLFIAHHYYVMKVNLIIFLFNIKQSSSIYQPLTKQSLMRFERTRRVWCIYFDFCSSCAADSIFMH